jgi:hypothetical protein
MVLHVPAGHLQLCPDLCVLLCGLCAGRAFLIPRHLPIKTLDIVAKQGNSWLRGPNIRISFLRNTEKKQKNLDKFS